MDNIRDNMGKSIYRYQKRCYKRVFIKKELWERMRDESAKLGMSIPSFIEYLLNNYLNTNLSNVNNVNVKKEKGLTRFTK
jgi:hypothetical protein